MILEQRLLHQFEVDDTIFMHCLKSIEFIMQVSILLDIILIVLIHVHRKVCQYTDLDRDDDYDEIPYFTW